MPTYLKTGLTLILQKLNQKLWLDALLNRLITNRLLLANFDLNLTDGTENEGSFSKEIRTCLDRSGLVSELRNFKSRYNFRDEMLNMVLKNVMGSDSTKLKLARTESLRLESI